MTPEMWLQVVLAVIGLLLAVIGFCGAYILYGMKEEMASTRVEISLLGENVAKILTTLDWHQKWLERHDDDIQAIRNNN